MQNIKLLGGFMLVEKSFLKILDEISAKEPVPGGGSVSAITLSLSCALSIMVTRFSNPENSHLLRETEEKFQNISKRATQIVDEDIVAYNKVVEAYKLPKSNAEEKKIRRKSVDEALVEATKPPFEGAELSYESIVCLYNISDLFNKNLLSDFIISQVLLGAAFTGFLANVRINLCSCKSVPTDLLEKVEILEKKFYKVRDKLQSHMEKGIKFSEK